MTTGIITARGPAIVHRGVTVQLPATRTPLGDAVAAVIADIDAGEIVACPHCGAVGGCDCLDWIEWMAAVGYPPKEETDAAA
jgi:hypothetical protein